MWVAGNYVCGCELRVRLEIIFRGLGDVSENKGGNETDAVKRIQIGREFHTQRNMLLKKRV